MFIGLDHTGLAVRDLDAARDLFVRLGFTLTPREALTKPGPDGKPLSTGADNHVFMLEQGYQELITITDPAAGHMLLPRLERYWGLHIIIVETDDAEGDCDKLARAGIPVSPCVTWGREVPGRGEARFRFFVVMDPAAPECVLGVVQHLTPELLRTPELLVHANGAKAIRGCTMHVADVVEARARYGRLFGSLAGAKLEGDEVRFANGTYLRLFDKAALAKAYPDAEFPAAPALAAVEFSVRNMPYIAASGVPMRQDGDACWLAPQDAFGGVIRFVPA